MSFKPLTVSGLVYLAFVQYCRWFTGSVACGVVNYRREYLISSAQAGLEFADNFQTEHMGQANWLVTGRTRRPNL